MACHTGTAQFCKYVQEESKRIRMAILDPHYIRSSRLHDLTLLQQPAMSKGPRLRDSIEIQNPNCGRTQNRRRRRKHQREVPPSSSRPPPCRALPVAPITKTSSASGDDEITPEKTRRRRKLCSMMRKYGRCTRQKCLKWHPGTETETEAVDTQKLDQRKATSSLRTTTVMKPKEKQSKKGEQQEQQQVTKKIFPAIMPKVQPQRNSTAGLMDQIKRITTPGWDDSEDEDEDGLPSSSQEPDLKEDDIKIEIYLDKDQPKQPEISPHFQRHPPRKTKGKGKRQHLAVAAAMGDDKPIPLEAAWVWGLAGGRYRKVIQMGTTKSKTEQTGLLSR